MAPVVAGIGLALSAVGTFKQAQAQKKAAKISQAQANLQERRERRRIVRAARAQRANIVAAEANQVGAGATSAAAGGAGAVTSNQSANLSFLNNSARLQTAFAGAQSDAATFGALASVGGQIFSGAGGFGAFIPTENKTA